MWRYIIGFFLLSGLVFGTISCRLSDYSREWDTTWPEPGNPDGNYTVPSEAAEEDVSNPDTVIGDGTPESCTGQLFVDAVAQGGVIVFDCGPEPVVIPLPETAKVYNNNAYGRVIIDGGGTVALSGMNRHRILYQNTIDEDLVITDSDPYYQDYPHLVVQNLVFIDGNAKDTDPGGGGAIFVQGGRFKIVNCRFFNNVCDEVGPDVGGGAVRSLHQYNDIVYITNSTFGGRSDLGNSGSNGGGISSLKVSHTVINSLMSYNTAIGYGANPPENGAPGGGSGGAIYNDGAEFYLNIAGCLMEENTANEGGGAIFFVSNTRDGDLIITDSVLTSNESLNFETPGYPGIYYLGAYDIPTVINSTIE